MEKSASSKPVNAMNENEDNSASNMTLENQEMQGVAEYLDIALTNSAEANKVPTQGNFNTNNRPNEITETFSNNQMNNAITDLNNEKGNNVPTDEASGGTKTEEANKYADMFQNKIKNNFEKVFFNNISNVNSKRKFNRNEESGLKMTSSGKTFQSGHKTVFTKISEDAFNKMLKNKSKVSCYDEMVSDNYLLKMKEKITAESTIKMNSFLERTRDHGNRKSLVQHENNAKSVNLMNNKMSHSSNIINLSSMKTVRSPERYMQDQIYFVEKKEEKLNMARTQCIKESEMKMKPKPKISTKSRSLAMKKNKDGKDIHTRLFEEKTHKLKSVLESESKLNKNKLPEKKIANLVNKLYSEAMDRLNKKNMFEKMEGIIKFDYNTNNARPHSQIKNLRSSSESPLSHSPFISVVEDHDYDITSNSSKLIVMKKFIKEFEVAVININRHREPLDFDRFCELICNLGFVVNIHKNSNNNEVINEGDATLTNGNYRMTKSENKSITVTGSNNINLITNESGKSVNKELVLVKDSWRVLTKKKNIEYGDTVLVDQILLFLLTILGLYKGELNSEENKNIEKNNLPLSENNINNENEIPKLRIESPTRNIANAGLSKSQTKFTKLSQSSANINKPPVEFVQNLLKHVMPQFDTKLFYENKIVRQLKSFFKTFYDNRTNFLGKINEEKQKEKLSKYKQPSSQFTFRPAISQKSFRTAEEYQEKLVEVASNIAESENTPMDSTTKRLKVQEVYNILQRKKENELRTLKQAKDEAELVECTFSPVINKRRKSSVERSKSQNVAKRLYSHAMNKLLRFESIYREKKEDSFEKDTKECTFSPKTVELKNKLFSNNPLQNDNLIKKGVSRYEKARIERKLKDFIIQKGLIGLNKIKNMDEILNEFLREESLPQFRFDNEVTQSKDNFGKYHKYSQDNFNKSKFNLTVKKNSSDLTDTLTKQPLFTFNVLVSDSRKEQFCFYPDDDPILATEKFCFKFGLKGETKDNILNLIEEKLSEI